MSSNTGRKGTAKCGHPGTAIIGQYYECDLKCHRKVTPSDGVPIEIDDEPVTKPLCIQCGSDELYSSSYPMWGTIISCKTCGKLQP